MNCNYTKHLMGKVIFATLFLLASQTCLFAQSPFYQLHWADNSDPVFTAGGTLLTQSVDTTCSQLGLSVIDPVGDPLPAFRPLVINPKDSAGNELADFSGQLSFHVRVRSRDSVRLGFQLRSGDGTTPNRSLLQESIVPADTMNWTEITFSIDTANIGGFDSTDLRDIWFFLDRGDANYAGDEFYFDYIAVGAKPDPANNSICPLTSPSNFPYTLHWADTLDPTFTSGGFLLTQAVDENCSQLGLSVTDPVGAPLPAFRPLVINPKDAMGNELSDFSGQLSFHVRVRSKDSVRLGFQLRSGDGSTPNRSVLQEEIVPADTMNWTEITFSIDTANIGGFDSTDLRDIWFFLDRGDANFAGDEFYFDYFAVGAKPDPADNSACPETPVSFFPYTIHWTDTLDRTFTNGGFLLTQTIDTSCSQLSLAVTDPVGAPLPAQRSLVLRPKDAAGDFVVDFSNQLDFYIRLRSKDSIRLAFQLRSGGGSTSERTDLQEVIVPADLMNWTEITFSVDAGNLGGFDSTNLRDIWLFLDKGDSNFAGNEVYVDYFAIGAKPDPADNSPCSLAPAFMFPYTLHWADTTDGVFTGSAAAVLTQSVDTACSQLTVSVTDPDVFPHPAFSPLIINPQDEMSNDISDFSGQLNFHVRVRSRDSVRLGFLLRSGDGTTPNRSILQEEIVPGDTMNWTEITFSIDTSNIGGFDSTDLRDIWFYLDRGEENFAGNEVIFDYVAVGTKPDPSEDSPCSLTPAFMFPYTLHWADTLDRVFTNGGSSLTQIIDTTCSQLGLSVTDPTGDPLPAHKSLVINPQDEFGNEIVDFSGQLRFYARVRSKESIRLGFQLRSGDGSSSNRTDLQEIVVPADLMNWTEVVFNVSADNIGGFDSTDLRDVWFFLDKGNVNFAGDELYFDYVSIGSKPDTSTFSTCTQSVGIEELTALEAVKIYPNPSFGDQAIRLAFSSKKQTQLLLRVYDSYGKLVQDEAVRVHPGEQEHILQPKGWAAGIYTIQLLDEGKVKTLKWLIN